MERRLLMELQGSRLKTKEWFPKRILIFEDHLELHDVGFLKKTIESLRYEQIAQVVLKRGILWSELWIESRGGKSITAKGLSKEEAEEAKSTIHELMGQVAGARGSAPWGTRGAVPAGGETKSPSSVPDIPEQIRKLAELRDVGAISNEEFEAKKKDLLSRM